MFIWVWKNFVLAVDSYWLNFCLYYCQFP